MAKKKSASKSKPADSKSASSRTVDGKESAAKDSPSFEQSLTELERVVADLEAGNLPLSESIERYEAGVKLLKHCHKALDQVQRKIEVLTQVGEDGQATTVPFDAEGTPADKPARGKPPSNDDSESLQDMDESGRLF